MSPEEGKEDQARFLTEEGKEERKSLYNGMRTGGIKACSNLFVGLSALHFYFFDQEQRARDPRRPRHIFYRGKTKQQKKKEGEGRRKLSTTLSVISLFSLF